jgi:hypothetical protein
MRLRTLWEHAGLLADTESEDGPELRGEIPVITQTEEWDEDIHVPTFSTQAISYGLAQEEALDQQAEVFDRFSREVLGNSSVEASADESDEPAQGEHTIVMMGNMIVAYGPDPEPEPTIEFIPWSGNWTWPQAREADRRGKEERRAFEGEFGWMKEADRYLLGYGPYPEPWEKFVQDSEPNGETCFKAIEQRKPPEDHDRSPDETYMGAAVVVWSRTQVTALRHVGWVSCPMVVSGGILNKTFEELPRGCHVDLVLETPEVRNAVKTCADIIVRGLGQMVFCQLGEGRRLMDTWKIRGQAMVIREFEEEGDDADGVCFRAAAIREAWQAEKGAVERRE